MSGMSRKGKCFVDVRGSKVGMGRPVGDHRAAAVNQIGTGHDHGLNGSACERTANSDLDVLARPPATLCGMQRIRTAANTSHLLAMAEKIWGVTVGRDAASASASQSSSLICWVLPRGINTL